MTTATFWIILSCIDGYCGLNVEYPSRFETKIDCAYALQTTTSKTERKDYKLRCREVVNEKLSF